MKNRYLVMLLLVTTTFWGCKKDGCTDTNAENFCKECKNGGNCQFSANIVFWYNQNTSKTAIATGSNSFKYYVDGNLVGTTKATFHTNGVVDCDQDSVLKIAIALGSNKNKNAIYKVTDQDGVVIWEGNADLQAKQCTKVELSLEETREEIIEIKTVHGNMYMWLNKKTLKHRANFLKLARQNFYDSTTFHRCVNNFVIQGGDPLSKDNNPSNDGTGGPGYTIDAEIDTANYKHDYGAVGTARDNNPLKKSNGSQYYIVIQTNGSHFLDNNYTVFGKIIKGMDVALTINNQPKSSDRPKMNIYMDINLLYKTQKEITDQFGYSNFSW
ncbi:MAG: peptidylprolyl isomerase [Bacteroidia bacterium]